MIEVFFKDNFDQFLETLRPGDVILFSGESWISKSIKWFSDSEWNHVAFYVGDGYIIESTEAGVEKNSLEKRLKHVDKLLVRRCLLVSEEEIKKMIDYAEQVIYDGYDFLQLLSLGLYFLLRKIGIRWRLLVQNNRNRFICSELIYYLYLKIGIKIASHPELVTPQTIATSNIFIDISSIVIKGV